MDDAATAAFLRPLRAYDRRWQANDMCCNCTHCPSMTLAHKPDNWTLGPGHIADTVTYGWCEERGKNVTADWFCDQFEPKP